MGNGKRLGVVALCLLVLVAFVLASADCPTKEEYKERVKDAIEDYFTGPNPGKLMELQGMLRVYATHDFSRCLEEGEEGFVPGENVTVEVNQSEIDEAISLIVEADRVLAETAIDFAKSLTVVDPDNQDGYGSEVLLAGDELAQAESFVVTNEFSNAVEHFRLAWGHARIAIRIANELPEEEEGHKGCYNNDVYWLDGSNRPVELVQECKLQCGSWPVNSFCHERSDGKVEKLMYPECFETYCREGADEEAYCYNMEDSYPYGVANIENRKAEHYTFTKNKALYQQDPLKYWYIGEPTDKLGLGKMPYYVDSAHPKIYNLITISGVYWDGDGVLVRDPKSQLAKVPSRILSDLIPFYEENDIQPYRQSRVCEGERGYPTIVYFCEDVKTSVNEKWYYKYTGECQQGFTDSYYYTNKKYVSAKCLTEDTPSKIEEVKRTTCNSGICLWSDVGNICEYWPTAEQFKIKGKSYREYYAHRLKHTKYKNCKPSLDLDGGQPTCCDNGGCAADSRCFENGFETINPHIGPIDSPKFGEESYYKCVDNAWEVS